MSTDMMNKGNKYTASARHKCYKFCTGFVKPWFHVKIKLF